MGVTEGGSGPWLDESIRLETFVPFLVRATANKLSQYRSEEYKRRFGVGLNEWSCLALLACEANIPASRICEVSGFDKAVISRSVQALEEKGFVATASAPDHVRKKLLSLTPSGRRLHDAIKQVVLEREERLLAGLTPDDRRRFVGYLRMLHGNVTALLDAR